MPRPSTIGTLGSARHTFAGECAIEHVSLDAESHREGRVVSRESAGNKTGANRSPMGPRRVLNETKGTCT
jgi:hypothetical protein